MHHSISYYLLYGSLFLANISLQQVCLKKRVSAKAISESTRCSCLFSNEFLSEHEPKIRSVDMIMSTKEYRRFLLMHLIRIVCFFMIDLMLFVIRRTFAKV